MGEDKNKERENITEEENKDNNIVPFKKPKKTKENEQPLKESKKIDVVPLRDLYVLSRENARKKKPT